MVPSAAAARALARDIATRNADDADPFLLAAKLGIEVCFDTIDAEDGGTEALLVPYGDPPFEIICDPWVPPRRGDRIHFRVAHEVAHTMFYDWGATPPTRILRATRAEERFCDAFARALLGVAGQRGEQPSHCGRLPYGHTARG